LLPPGHTQPTQMQTNTQGPATPGRSPTRGRAEGGSTTPSMSGRLSSLTGLFRPGSTLRNRGSVSSRLSRAGGGTTTTTTDRSRDRETDLGRLAGDPAAIYDASVVGDSAEDLRAVMERQEREAGRLENVRACCDGTFRFSFLSIPSHFFSCLSCLFFSFLFLLFQNVSQAGNSD